YRLSPGVRYPDAIDDSVRVTRYILQHSQKYNVDLTRVFLAGDSAGANLAIIVERRLRNELFYPIRAEILLYPLMQLVNYMLPSYQKYLKYELLSVVTEDFLYQVPNYYLNTTFERSKLFKNQHLSKQDLNKFYSIINKQWLNQSDINDRSYDSNKPLSDDYYITSTNECHPDTSKLFHDDISPLLSSTNIISQTPSTFLVSCEYDVLLSDSLLYWKRLKDAHVEVEYRHYYIFHGAMTFVDWPVTFTDAFEIIEDSAEFIRNKI
ncbi:unnamed protein product, partial [Didymodactylos carnosus]